MVDALEREHTARSYYDDRFAELTPDVEWIKILAEDDPSWIIISGDGIDIKPRGIVVEKKGEELNLQPNFHFSSNFKVREICHWEDQGAKVKFYETNLEIFET